MTKKEMIKKVQEGEPIVVEMFTKRTNYSLGGMRITKNQYKTLKELFNGKLWANTDYHPAITRNTYTLKP